MSLTNSFPESLTPGRRTRLVFDVPDYHLVEPYWAETRIAREIGVSHWPGLAVSWGVQRMQSGLLGLVALNAEIPFQHETEEGENAIMGLADWNTVAGTVARAVFHPPITLPGLAGLASAALKAVAGDRFLTVDHQADESWDKALPTGVSAPPNPKAELYGDTPNVALNRVAESVVTHTEDTGYLLRWYQPGSPFTRQDLTFRFYFGGPVSARGHGQFCVTLSGSGRAYLHEFVDAIWTAREEWQFCNPQDAINVQHWMRIIPHGEAFIEFQSQISTAAHLGNRLMRRPAISRDVTVGDQTSFTHEVDASVIAERNPGSRRFVTGPGQPRWDMRADSRPMFQVARLIYRTSGALPSGQIVDQPIQVPWGMGPASLGSEQPLDLATQWLAGPDPAAHSVFLALYNSGTGVELAQSGDQYLAPGGDSGIIPILRLNTTDAYHSPFIRSYTLSRPAVIHEIAPGEWTAEALQTSIVGTGTDPATESASFSVRDTFGALDLLRNRGGIPFECRCVLDEVEEVTLFRGYLTHSAGRFRPHLNAAGDQWPAANWHDYELEGTGMWRRLTRATFPPRLRNFSSDDEHGLSGQPWKVTDVLRECFALAGFPPGQLDIPDYPMRLWASGEKETSVEAWMPTPGSPIGPYLVEAAADYLGAYILWDPNAGSLGGMWRLKLQPRPGATPLYTFFDDYQPEITGVPRLTHVKGAYPDATWMILKEGGQSSLVEWTEPPENSAVIVCSPGSDTGLKIESWAINTNAVDVPAWGTFANPASPDYTDGGFFPLRDMLLYIPPGEAGQRFTRWRCRRLFDQACRARRFKRFAAPVDYVTDPGDALLNGRKRLLRYGDTVNVNEAECFITSYSVVYGKEGAQKATVEVQEFLEDLEVSL